MLRRFHEDLERVGLRARRQHDARRTFISIARADGARPDILRWATHGPTGDIVDDYTTLPCCEEVAKVRVSVLEGKVIELPLAATGTTEAFAMPDMLAAASVTRLRAASEARARHCAQHLRSRSSCSKKLRPKRENPRQIRL
jgi:hypothetical protein